MLIYLIVCIHSFEFFTLIHSLFDFIVSRTSVHTEQLNQQNQSTTLQAFFHDIQNLLTSVQYVLEWVEQAPYRLLHSLLDTNRSDSIVQTSTFDQNLSNEQQFHVDQSSHLELICIECECIDQDDGVVQFPLTSIDHTCR